MGRDASRVTVTIRPSTFALHAVGNPKLRVHTVGALPLRCDLRERTMRGERRAERRMARHYPGIVPNV
jgi:hypothetical protein